MNGTLLAIANHDGKEKAPLARGFSERLPIAYETGGGGVVFAEV